MPPPETVDHPGPPDSDPTGPPADTVSLPTPGGTAPPVGEATARLLTLGDAPPAAGPDAGDDGPHLPGYRLDGEVGRGGMGVVYRGWDIHLDRPVAVKMVLGGVPDRAARARFQAEVESIAQLRHPHVVRVYQSGEHAGRPFVVLEYLPGGTLADRLRGGARLPPAEAAALVRTLAGAVQAAHDAGVVHRDLKPENVLFDADGAPKVADFGLAKRAGGGDLTRTQAVMGTPQYMAPEQARGDAKFAGPGPTCGPSGSSCTSA